MGKGNRMVVISSDDDDDDEEENRSSSCSARWSKSRSSGCSTNPRPTKRPRISRSKSRSSKELSNVDEVRLSFEDFDEVLNGFKVSATGYGSRKTDELWVDKYRPCTLEELAVQKRKVEEVRTWLEDRLSTSKYELRTHFLLITGPAGVGKSATIHAIASHLGVKLYEWDAPTPTIWLEHKHNTSSGLQYTSKLDEFENFVERTRKYGLITSSAFDRLKSPSFLLIDDLPATNGRPSFERLRECLLLLARSTQVPTILLVTDYGESDSADKTSRYLEELKSSLGSAGACKVSFNPVTKNLIKKTLEKIRRKECCSITADEIDQIASASGGDIRQAITSLQLVCLRPEQCPQNANLKLSSSKSCYSRDEETQLNLWDGGISHFGRDETLSLFHALGKFLHNKRVVENNISSGSSDFLLNEQFSRLPLNMDAPEKVLCQAHGQARPVADFLHENVLDFISDEAMDAAWAVSSYLADADILLASFRGTLARHIEVENVLQSAAASVAVRGVLYGNNHPSSSRWHAIRRPKLWQVEQSSTRNKNEMVRQRSIYNNESRVSEVSVLATEYTTALKWLRFRASEGQDYHRRKAECDGPGRSLDEQESEVSDIDEIEDW